MTNIYHDALYTFYEYQEQAMRTAPQGFTPYQLITDAAYGLCSEAGEVIGHLKKHEFQGHDLNIDDVCEEVGDLLWYCAMFAQGAGISLSEIAQRNIGKLRARYPDGFDPDKSIHRAKAEE
jgi:NTP pyrophosphatase (non-canonical NTP hydrolase)